MSYRHAQLGNKRIYYQLDELFCRVTAEQFLRIFQCTLPYPLGCASGMLLQSGERFDVMTEFAGPIFANNEIDPSVLLNRFACSTNECSELSPYVAYVVHRHPRDFVVSYDSQRGSLLFSTSITLTGENKKYAHVLDTALFNWMNFSEVFVSYMESLCEFIEFIYDACGVDISKLINPYITYDEVIPNIGTREPQRQKQCDGERIDLPPCKILQFVRPKK